MHKYFHRLIAYLARQGKPKRGVCFSSGEGKVENKLKIMKYIAVETEFVIK